MSANEQAIKNAVVNEYPNEANLIESIEIGNPLDGADTRFKVFVTYGDGVLNREYHRTFYAIVSDGTCVLDEDAEACINAECYCLDEG